MQRLIGATLIDGTGTEALPDAVILIDDEGCIQAVGRAAEVPESPGAEVLDLTGLTVLPGLIDAHDHLAHQGYGLPERWGLNEPQSTAHLRTAGVLRQTLETGYTTVRDAAGLDAGFKQAIDQGLIRGPRLKLALAIISPIGGIGDRVSPSGHCCCVAPSPNVPSSVANGVDEVRKVVRTMVRAGADVIKCATTGGASSREGHGPKDKAFNRDEMEALIDESHALGRRVMCHALGGPGLRMAIELGVDSIEHGCFLDEDEALIPMMAEKGIFFVPTLTVYKFHRERSAPHIRERGRILLTHHLESVQRALDAGVTIVAGTDAGGHEHGNNALELQLLVEAGLTEMQALRAGTQWAADCLDMTDEIGTVEPGKRADLVVVEGNPLQDIKILQEMSRVKLVLKDGVISMDRRQMD